jgi:chromosome segregation ATPase
MQEEYQTAKDGI